MRSDRRTGERFNGFGQQRRIELGNDLVRIRNGEHGEWATDNLNDTSVALESKLKEYEATRK